MQILKIENADIYRGQTQVFHGLNLEIELGQNTAIVGPNGAGKTTLLKSLAREIYPASGTISIFGKERWNVWELRKNLGLVSNDLQQNYTPTAKGFDVVLSGFYSSIDVFGHQVFANEQIAAANRIVNELGIDSIRKKPFSKMSTGEQRRHLLARALINDPQALILDEPTSGLDLPATFLYLDTIRSLMRSGKTLILVTHHIHEIPPEVSHVVLMKQGKILFEGDKNEGLTSENLSQVFDVKVSVTESDGYFQVYPGSPRN